ncbi:hypothetical protein IAT40_005428 [Kwoniella sp. CBS 6097]
MPVERSRSRASSRSSRPRYGSHHEASRHRNPSTDLGHPALLTSMFPRGAEVPVYDTDASGCVKTDNAYRSPEGLLASSHATIPAHPDLLNARGEWGYTSASNSAGLGDEGGMGMNADHGALLGFTPNLYGPHDPLGPWNMGTSPPQVSAIPAGSINLGYQTSQDYNEAPNNDALPLMLETPASDHYGTWVTPASLGSHEEDRFEYVGHTPTGDLQEVSERNYFGYDQPQSSHQPHYIGAGTSGGNQGTYPYLGGKPLAWASEGTDNLMATMTNDQQWSGVNYPQGHNPWAGVEDQSLARPCESTDIFDLDPSLLYYNPIARQHQIPNPASNSLCADGQASQQMYFGAPVNYHIGAQSMQQQATDDHLANPSQFEQPAPGSEFQRMHVRRNENPVRTSAGTLASYSRDFETTLGATDEESAQADHEGSQSVTEDVEPALTDNEAIVPLTDQALARIRADADSREFGGWLDALFTIDPNIPRNAPKGKKFSTIMTSVAHKVPKHRATYAHWRQRSAIIYQETINQAKTAFLAWQKNPESTYSRQVKEMRSLEHAEELAETQAWKASEIVVGKLGTSQMYKRSEGPSPEVEKSDLERMMLHLSEPWSNAMKEEYRRIVSESEANATLTSHASQPVDQAQVTAFQANPN